MSRPDDARSGIAQHGSWRGYSWTIRFVARIPLHRRVAGAARRLARSEAVQRHLGALPGQRRRQHLVAMAARGGRAAQALPGPDDRHHRLRRRLSRRRHLRSGAGLARRTGARSGRMGGGRRKRADGRPERHSAAAGACRKIRRRFLKRSNDAGTEAEKISAGARGSRDHPGQPALKNLN